MINALFAAIKLTVEALGVEDVIKPLSIKLARMSTSSADCFAVSETVSGAAPMAKIVDQD
jgi:hypothetical protein